MKSAQVFFCGCRYKAEQVNNKLRFTLRQEKCEAFSSYSAFPRAAGTPAARHAAAVLSATASAAEKRINK
ncbi:hypothetical protein E2C01_076459 [Portunus trituberculatus]|uniref:Uncharacterized protein n=1 Tax=Portunus trituberculatus TaxID=210409 RepID=A0A5B7INK8_PORTR|nr:hypothetical protein [Portunus trituberculatus]